MPDGFKSFEEIFRSEPGLKRIRGLVKNSDVIIRFHEIFPEFIKVAKPEKVVKKTLFLVVENPSWRSELKYNEARLINKINEYFDEERISAIRFTS